MATTDAARRTARRIGLLLCVAVPPAFGLLALALGQDANWDLRNYHWYNPYALLTGRWEFDVGVGATYNPLVDVPMYLAAQALSAKTLSALLGAVQGLNFVLLFALARTLLAPAAEPGRTIAAGLAALVGATGAGTIALVGTTFNDSIISLAVLGAALTVARGIDVLAAGPVGRALARAALAGLLVGIGAGLKLPAAVFAVGLCGAMLAAAGASRRGLMLAAANGLGVLAGIALSDGAWMWRMWVDYRNPLFPYFNALFGSPMGLAESYRDTRFLPKSLVEGVFFPLVMSADPKHVGEIQFRDYRILALFVLLLATPVVARAARRGATVPLARPRATRTLIAAAVIAFAVWAGVFAVYRYIVAIEMLAPVLAVALIALWPLPVRARAITAAAVLLALAVTTAPGNWGRRRTWTHRLVEVTPPPIADPAHAMVVLVGVEPLSYVIPFLPPEVPVLRLEGYLTDPRDVHTGLNRLLRRRLAAHRGDIYLLTAHWERPTAVAALRPFGLVADFGRCGTVASNLKPAADLGQRIELCPVARVETLEGSAV